VAGFDLMACREICAELAVVACDGPESACLGRCAVEQTAFSGTACQREFEAMTTCARADVPNNYECSESGVPIVKAEACVAEQDALIVCALTAG
jgi:hypothetical protein